MAAEYFTSGPIRVVFVEKGRTISRGKCQFNQSGLQQKVNLITLAKKQNLHGSRLLFRCFMKIHRRGWVVNSARRVTLLCTVNRPLSNAFVLFMASKFCKYSYSEGLIAIRDGHISVYCTTVGLVLPSAWGRCPSRNVNSRIKRFAGYTLNTEPA